jgi:tRNA nucleotidyltransferase (CCA-adding enzyme)
MHPLINGKALQKVLQTSPGAWMKPALNIIMAWQLRNPGITDPAEAIEAVRASDLVANIQGTHEGPKEKHGRHGKYGKHQLEGNAESTGTRSQKKKDLEKGELTSALIHHFLHETLRPIFVQTSKHREVTEAGRRKIGTLPNRRFMDEPLLDDEAAKPWKYHHSWALDLLTWITKALSVDAKIAEREWGSLIPPILNVLDDTDVKIRARGCTMLQNLLVATPSALLNRTGLAPLFRDSLFASLTYLPTLTPESESVLILNSAYPALLQLVDTWHPPSPSGSHIPQPPERVKALDQVMRKGILFTHAHASEYVHITETLLTHLPDILGRMGIDSVKYLKDLLPMLSGTLSDPFITAYPPLLAQAALALQAVILNAWPRIGLWRAEVLRGLAVCWLRIQEEAQTPELEDITRNLRDTVQILVAAEERNGTSGALKDGLEKILDVEPQLSSLFEEPVS